MNAVSNKLKRLVWQPTRNAALLCALYSPGAHQHQPSCHSPIMYMAVYRIVISIQGNILLMGPSLVEYPGQAIEAIPCGHLHNT